MPFMMRTRHVNPRLGTYFGIFASAFAALFLLLLIFEQLGASAGLLRFVMLIAPLVLYASIGLACATRQPIEYFAAGRRVPAVYNGLGLAMTAMGGTGLAAMGGLFFLIGFDALWLVSGGLAGFAVMAVLLAPFLRKFGAFTIPTYLGRRFDSRALRLLAAAVVAVPMLLMLTAEIIVGTRAASMLFDVAPSFLTVLIAVALGITIAAGGMRALTWSGVAKLIAALLALMAPVATVAVLLTNLPLPQLTTGPLLRSLVSRERIEGLANGNPGSAGFDLPGQGWEIMAKPFASAFGSVGPYAFTIATFTVMAGVASAPWLLPRIATAANVYDARKSLGWATFCFGVIALTLAAVAIFMRDFIIDYVSLTGPAPVWLAELETRGFAAFDASRKLDAASIAFRRDAVLLSLPIAAGMPSVLFHLAAAGLVAVAMAAAGAVALALGNVFAEDVVSGLSWSTEPAAARLWTARAALIVALALGSAVAIVAPGDPLRLMVWAFVLTGSSLFPVLVLSIWWKALNAFGAIAGLATGFAVSAIAIFAGESGLIALDSMLAGAIAMPAALLAIVLAARFTPAPGRHALELLRDIRVPGGEILYDRELRLARLKERPAG